MEVTRTDKIDTIEVRKKCLLSITVAELSVVVAVSTQDDEKILRTTLAELLVEIAFIDFLLADVALSNCPVLRVLRSTNSSIDGRN